MFIISTFLRVPISDIHPYRLSVISANVMNLKLTNKTKNWQLTNKFYISMIWRVIRELLTVPFCRNHSLRSTFQMVLQHLAGCWIRMKNLLSNHQNQKGQSETKIKGEGNFLPKFRNVVFRFPKIPVISIIQVTGSTSCQWLQLSYRGKKWMAVTWTIANAESESPTRWYTAIQPVCYIIQPMHFWQTIEYHWVFDAAQLGGPKPIGAVFKMYSISFASDLWNKHLNHTKWRTEFFDGTRLPLLLQTSQLSVFDTA